MVAQGKIEFLKKWGDRKLEDNWRRSTKEKDLSTDNTIIDSLEAEIMNKKNKKNNIPNTDKDGFVGVRLDKNTLKDQIPLTEDKKKKSENKLISSMYHLGKIYQFKLDEFLNAKKIYERLLNQFPNSNYEAEVFYMLRLICIELKDKPCEEKYFNLLISSHPESVFAKMLINPDWEKIAKKQKLIEEQEYKICLKYYTDGKYRIADSLLVQFKTKYSESELMDKVELLRALILAKNRFMDDYKKALLNFIEDYPKSNLTSHAKFLYEMCEKMENSEEYNKPKQLDKSEKIEIDVDDENSNKDKGNSAETYPNNSKKPLLEEQSTLPQFEDIDIPR
jgi:TolA-binding protein